MFLPPPKWLCPLVYIHAKPFFSHLQLFISVYATCDEYAKVVHWIDYYSDSFFERTHLAFDWRRGGIGLAVTKLPTAGGLLYFDPKKHILNAKIFREFVFTTETLRLIVFIFSRWNYFTNTGKLGKYLSCNKRWSNYISSHIVGIVPHAAADGLLLVISSNQHWVWKIPEVESVP